MRPSAHRIGAVFYVIWGVLHVIAGAVMLRTLASDGGTAAMAILGNGVAREALTQDIRGVTMGAIGLMSWDLIWFGTLVPAVAITLNWKNATSGFWITLAIVLVTDLAYLYAIILPGYVVFPRGYMGPGAAVLAIGFSVFGHLNRPVFEVQK